jgi:Icc-related predicted phosphoesterase
MLKPSVRLAAVGDIHYARSSRSQFQSLWGAVAESADVLLLCGDIIDYGLPEEAQLFTKELTSIVKLPTLAVLGNHEYESSKQDEVLRIFADAGVVVLDGDAEEIYGIGFAGAKGFGGGFGEAALQAWGEDLWKRVVHEAVNETLKLESALAKLRTSQRIVLLHYAPIQTTVEGEPPEIFAFLGSSRLEEPLNRYPVTTVFHGHAHRGLPEGRTKSGVAVYNVAMPLLRRSFPERPPFRLVEITATDAVSGVSPHPLPPAPLSS